MLHLILKVIADKYNYFLLKRQNKENSTCIFSISSWSNQISRAKTVLILQQMQMRTDEKMLEFITQV